jgi:DNA-binding MarR family transcriptional regulator
MADVISSQRKPRTRPAAAAGLRLDAAPPAKALSARDVASLMPFVEMLFFAYRDFTGEADAALAAYGLGRAHHRVLHFVNRHPSIRVADLLELLKITKQSLGRVLRQLVADGWIEQLPGPEDRRERRLTLTSRGRNLAAELAHLQARRIETALDEIETVNGATARDSVSRFLFALIAENERATVAALVAAPPPTPSKGGV